MNDFQTWFNVVMGLVVPVGIIISKRVFEKIDEARDRADETGSALLAYKTHAAETFLTVKRFEGFEERLFGELRAIRESLADKADRL